MKLSSDEIKATALTGTVRVTKHGPMGQPVKEATLQDGAGRDILPPLRCAKVVTVGGGGLMVHGNISYFAGIQERGTGQTWWCVPSCARSGLSQAGQLVAPGHARP